MGGNRRADEIYGSKKVSPSASKDEKQRFVVDKYKNKTFADQSRGLPRANSSVQSPLRHAMTGRTCGGSLFDFDVAQPQSEKSEPATAMATQRIGHAPVARAVHPKPVDQKASAQRADIPDSFFDTFDDFCGAPADAKALTDATHLADSGLTLTKASVFDDLFNELGSGTHAASRPQGCLVDLLA